MPFAAIRRREWGRRPMSLGGVIGLLSCVCLLVCAASASPSTTTAGLSPFDGDWIIDATSSAMFCPIRTKQLVAVVQGGRITKLTGLPSAKATGAVRPDGAISVQLRTLGHTATISGKLLGPSAGEGAWSADSLICSGGTWRAHASR